MYFHITLINTTKSLQRTPPKVSGYEALKKNMSEQ